MAMWSVGSSVAGIGIRPPHVTRLCVFPPSPMPVIKVGRSRWWPAPWHPARCWSFPAFSGSRPREALPHDKLKISLPLTADKYRMRFSPPAPHGIRHLLPPLHYCNTHADTGREDKSILLENETTRVQNRKAFFSPVILSLVHFIFLCGSDPSCKHTVGFTRQRAKQHPHILSARKTDKLSRVLSQGTLQLHLTGSHGDPRFNDLF